MNSGYLLCEVTAGLKAGWGSVGGSGRILMSGVDFEGFNRGLRGGGLTIGAGGVTGECARLIGGTVSTSAECAALNNLVK